MRSGTRAIVPSSFMISQTTPAGLSPARRARSTAASVWPARWSTPPGRARSGKTWPGWTRSCAPLLGSIATWIVRERSGAEIPVVIPSRASIETVNAVPYGVSFSVRHRAEPELVAALLGQAEADEPAPVRGHEVDRLGGGELRRDREVAFVLAVGGVDDDDELAVRGCPRSPPRSWRTARRLRRAGSSPDRYPGASVPEAAARLEQALDVLGEHVDLDVDLVARARDRRASSPRACAGRARPRPVPGASGGDGQADAVDA